MASDKDTDQAATWYPAATPDAVSQWLGRLWRATAALDVIRSLQRKLSKDPVPEGH